MVHPRAKLLSACGPEKPGKQVRCFQNTVMGQAQDRRSRPQREKWQRKTGLQTLSKSKTQQAKCHSISRPEKSHAWCPALSSLPPPPLPGSSSGLLAHLLGGAPSQLKEVWQAGLDQLHPVCLILVSFLCRTNPLSHSIPVQACSFSAGITLLKHLSEVNNVIGHEGSLHAVPG